MERARPDSRRCQPGWRRENAAAVALTRRLHSASTGKWSRSHRSGAPAKRGGADRQRRDAGTGSPARPPRSGDEPGARTWRYTGERVRPRGDVEAIEQIGLASFRRIVHRGDGTVWSDADAAQAARVFFTIPPG
jgi:hypothetical protein